MRNLTHKRVADADLPESTGIVVRYSHLDPQTVVVRWEMGGEDSAFETYEHLSDLIIIG